MELIETLSASKRVLRGVLFACRNPGKARFLCPVCSYAGPFRDLQAGTGYRENAECPRCGALERHRLQYLVLQRLFGGKEFGAPRVLHFAPEGFFRRFFAEIAESYETADFVVSSVTHKVDIQDMPFADESHDLIFASHVLEHVRDDIRALKEIRRILRPGGVAILPVPVVAEATVEYPNPNPYESNHWRAPGFDYFDRYRRVFDKVALYDSRAFPEHHQLFVYEDRSHWPSRECPLRPSMKGDRHLEIVPLCYR